jgi:hypothetical protein
VAHRYTTAPVHHTRSRFPEANTFCLWLIQYLPPDPHDEPNENRGNALPANSEPLANKRSKHAARRGWERLARPGKQPDEVYHTFVEKQLAPPVWQQ